MTVEDVKRRVEAIRVIAGDDEAAHSAEDKLWCDVLTSIGNGTSVDGWEMARQALKTQEIDFARWCA